MPGEAANVELRILPAYAAPTVEGGFHKPAGTEKVMFSWGLSDSSGLRVPVGYYAVEAERDGRGKVGAIHVTH